MMGYNGFHSILFAFRHSLEPAFPCVPHLSVAGHVVRTLAQRTASIWISFPGIFQTMIVPDSDCIGIGVTHTPGIDAHAEHTEIAEKEIRESDVILFVMDNADTFDNALVYRAIVDILDMGKPLAVVINQKNVDDEEDDNIPVPVRPSVKRIVGKVSLNLETQGQRNGAQLVAQRKNFLGIFPANGLMACGAKQLFDEGERELYLDISGISDLRNALDTTVARSQQVYMLQTPLINLRDTLRQAAEFFQAAPIYGEKQQMARNREMLLLSRQRLRDRLLANGLRKIEAALEQVKSAAANGQPVEDPGQRLNEELNGLLREAAEQEQVVLKTELDIGTMPEHRLSAAEAAEVSDEESDFRFVSLAPALPIIVDLPEISIPVIVLLSIADAIADFFRRRQREEEATRRAAIESQERLANYYRWLNELRDQESKMKAGYEKLVNDFLVQTYDSKLAELDQALAEVDSGCAAHTKALRELERLQLQVGDELISLAVY